MTQEQFVRRLPELMDELGRGDDTYLDDILRQTAALGQHGRWPLSGRRFELGPIPGVRLWREHRRRLVMVGLLTLLALVVGAALYAGSRQQDPRPLTLSNGWIAYSSTKGGVELSGLVRFNGSDISIIRAGVLAPIVIASRGDGAIWNVCPAFSPDGRLLAFGTSTGRDTRFVIVLRVEDDGTTMEVARVPVPGSGLAPCAIWSRDGTRLAYVEAGAAVIRGLDGSVRSPTSGDPTLADIDRIVRDFERNLRSPDGKWLLSMSDTGASSFVLKVTPIQTDADSLVLVSSVPTNTARSFPGRGDVSWQPVYR